MSSYTREILFGAVTILHEMTLGLMCTNLSFALYVYLFGVKICVFVIVLDVV